jgi:hypothetical protein
MSMRGGLESSKSCQMTRQRLSSLELIVGFATIPDKRQAFEMDTTLPWQARPDLARVSLAELEPSSRFSQALPLDFTPPLSTLSCSYRRR